MPKIITPPFRTEAKAEEHFVGFSPDNEKSGKNMQG